MRYAYFNPNDGKVIQWIDTEAFNYSSLPDASLLYACTDEEWQRQFLSQPQMVKDNAIVDYVAPPIPIATIRADVWQKIKDLRDFYKNGGVLVQNKWFNTDDSSRIQQIGIYLLGSNLPSSLKWRTMDGTFVSMTQSLITAVFQAIIAQDMAIFANAEAHREAMEASDDPASYDYSTGWPAIYQGDN